MYYNVHNLQSSSTTVINSMTEWVSMSENILFKRGVHPMNDPRLLPPTNMTWRESIVMLPTADCLSFLRGNPEAIWVMRQVHENDA